MKLDEYTDRLGLGDKLRRAAFALVWGLLCRPTPAPLHAWRALVLRAFGARLGRRVHVYPSARVWAPWNLEMGEHACLAPDVRCYTVAKITIGAHSVVSQGAHLCSAGHDIRDRTFPLTSAPIVIGTGVWVAADAFVGPGVRIGDGAVVGACACVTRDVAAGDVVAGNPAERISRRELSA